MHATPFPLPHIDTPRPPASCCARMNARLGGAIARGMVRASSTTTTPPLAVGQFAVLRYATNRRSEPPLP
jgi:hypothetical protein